MNNDKGPFSTKTNSNVSDISDRYLICSIWPRRGLLLLFRCYKIYKKDLGNIAS